MITMNDQIIVNAPARVEGVWIPAHGVCLNRLGVENVVWKKIVNIAGCLADVR